MNFKVDKSETYNMKTKIKQTLGALVLTVAAFAAPSALAGGIIRSIEPVATEYRSQYGAANPVRSGQDLAFRFRVIADDGSLMPIYMGSDTNCWTLAWGGSSADAIAAMAMTPPQIGIIVGNKLRFATLREIPTEAAKDSKCLTDLEFYYTVRPGDLASPVYLADSTGKRFSEASSSYMLNNFGEYSWRFTDIKTGTWTCDVSNFVFGDSTPPGFDPTKLKRDFWLEQADIHVRTFDFDESFASGTLPNGIWREIPAGTSETTTLMPTVTIPGGAATETTVYMWTKDPTIATVDGGNLVSGVTYSREFTIPAGTTNYTFRINGVAEGTTELYMGSTPTNVYDTTGSHMLTNFVWRNIKVGAPPQPSIRFWINDNLSEYSVACPSGEGYKLPVASVKVSVSRVYSTTEDLVVNLNPTLKGNGASYLFNNNIIAVRNNQSYTDSNITSVTIRKGQTYAYFYVYALGSDANSGKDGIVFTPSVDPSAQSVFTGGFTPCTLKVSGCAPVVKGLAPATANGDGSYTTTPLVGGVEQEFKISIEDAYANMVGDGKYTVTWYRGDGVSTGKSVVECNAPDEFGRITAKIRYPKANATGWASSFTVKNAQGYESSAVAVTAIVTEPLSVKLATEETTYVESDTAKVPVKITLTQSWDAQLWAFLVPMNADASNKTYSANFPYSDMVHGTGPNKGVAIPVGGGTDGKRAINVFLQDGDSYPEFQVVLCKTQTYDPAEVLGEYASDTLSLTVENVMPAMAEISVGGRTVDLEDEPPVVAMNVEKTFKFGVNDVAADVNGTNIDDCVVGVWKIYDGSYTATRYTFGTETNLTYAFSNIGTNKVVVYFVDKDSRKSGDIKFANGQWTDNFKVAARGPTYTFKVDVRNQPEVELDLYNSPDGTGFTEDQQNARIRVRLSEPSGGPDLFVKVTIEPNGDTLDNPNVGTCKFTDRRMEHVFRFSGQQSSWQTYALTDLDGTTFGLNPGWKVTAAVTNLNTTTDGVAWKDYYLTDTLEFTVQNVDPVIVSPAANTNLQVATLSMPIEPLEWNVSDIKADLTNNFKVIWFVNGKKVMEKISPQDGDVSTGTFTYTFTTAGKKTITLTVMDKDNAMGVSRSWDYKVEPNKHLILYPHYPHNSPLADLIAKYSEQPGVGHGMIWADGALSELSAFRGMYNYEVTAESATFYARGFEVGQEANGAFGACWNETGAGTNAPFYAYNDKTLDSFFYCFFSMTAGEESSTYSASVISLSPARGKGVTKEGSVPLPTFDEELVQYADRRVAAVFAKELYPADNLGDLNQDGVPDYFATLAWDGGRLYELAGESNQDAGNSGGTTISVSNSTGGDESSSTAPQNGEDLTGVANYNGDEDFLPKAYGSPFSAASWEPDVAFNAVDEIRGMHNGLNFFDKATMTFVSDPDLSPAEELALNVAWKAALAAGTTTAASAEEYLKSGAWSPENRTDPTIEDTDADGLPDGYEYTAWYYATVGAIVNGEWKRLTGLKFDLKNLGQGIDIPSEVVAQAFDPNVKRQLSGTVHTGILDAEGNEWTYDATDFDNDGLADLEEVALGTSAISCDTDGDGISDYWEVLHGLNPLSNTDGTRALASTDTRNNPDGDFMAWLEAGERTVVKLQDGSCWAFEKAPAFEAGEEVAGLKIGKAGKTEYYFESDPVLTDPIKDKTYLAVSTVAYRVMGEEKHVGIKVVLPAGTLLEYDAAQDVPDPAPTLATLSGKALKVFPYGAAEQKLFVPVKIDGVTEDDLPENAVVAEVLEAQTLVYIHHQVMQVAGFDPRTAWAKDAFGYVSARWHAANSVNATGTEGESGLAVNTMPYTSLDEFLVLRYRYEVEATKAVKFNAKRDVAGDLALVPHKLLNVFWGTLDNSDDFGGTTIPVEYITESDTNDTESAARDVYGADTDGDGVPDGWELYVNASPNNGLDGSSPDFANSCEDPSDGLTFVQEYAGTDSCNAYSNVPSIYNNHPGIKQGWYNKFFPTNPYDADTDGDGVADNKETGIRTGLFWCNRSEAYTGVKFSFIYGEPTDNGSCCIVGGGLNPCTVDTDQDLLPDGWEYEFAGVVFDANDELVDNSALSDLDVQTMLKDDGLGIRTSGYRILGGMDGTYADPNLDYDHDGLLNFQEYLVQSLRHLRYDDSETPLMGGYLPGGDASSWKFKKFIPMLTWDGASFLKLCEEAGFDGLTSYVDEKGNKSFHFDKLGYFTPAPHAWDRLACSKAAASVYAGAAYAGGPGYRIMLRPHGLQEDGSRFNQMIGGYTSADVCMYATTDPRRWDSDGDGMDDYYELFHGLNPLLGSSVDPAGMNGMGEANGRKYDRIAMIYSNAINSHKNAWTGWDADTFAAEPTAMFDAMRYPWMMGTAEADADGDGLRNVEESILVNLVKPENKHTDPTPLWYTDSTSTNHASFVSQYYCVDPYIPYVAGSDNQGGILFFPWIWNHATIVEPIKDSTLDGSAMNWMFAFEENEGYDSDHDWIPDNQELVNGVEPGSDPLDFTDPDRRQALWFDGEHSAAISYAGQFTKSYSTEYATYRQFTVECWVCPESAGEQVILERVSAYGASTLSNNVTMLARNFRLGITEGRFYAKYTGTTADSGEVRIVSKDAVEVGKWAHVAFTFDGSEARLYVNGDTAPVASAKNIALTPANGVIIAEQDPTALNNPVPTYGYSTVPTVFLLGAEALTRDAMLPTTAKDWATDFGSYFKGYIDEVRVWDGARTSTEIHDAYLTRFTADEVKALRESVFTAWKSGKRRGGIGGNGELEPELLQHYNFMTLPGAVNVTDVVTEPAGFTSAVADNVRINGSNKGVLQAGGIFCGWWALAPLHSTVYNDYRLVPWIPNTIRHLPALDGSTIDSGYWSHDYAGVLAASDCGVNEFDYPDTMSIYPYYYFGYDRYLHLLRALSLSDDAATLAQFDQRAGFLATDDLVPLGGAFAARAVTMWDGQGAADAWTQTGADIDANGVPDWWQAYAVATYGAASDFNWDSILVRDGLQMTAREAYKRDLAAGMLPTATVDEAYAAKSDTDADGMPDWWEKLYGLLDQSGTDDDDNDQLSNRSEYLIGEFFRAYGFPYVDPTEMFTATNGVTQKVPDYFLKVGKLYLGEMFSDHDLMEDGWEDKYDINYISRFLFDAFADLDQDGWSNRSECRAGTDPTSIAHLAVDEMTLRDHPIPSIKVVVAYNGRQIGVDDKTVVVKARKVDSATDRPDAIWSIAGAGSDGEVSDVTTSETNVIVGAKEKLLGINPRSEMTVNLGPGSVVPGTVSVSFKDLSYRVVVALEYTYHGIAIGTQEVSSRSGNSQNAEWFVPVQDKVGTGDSKSGDLVTTGGEIVGSVDYVTGRASIDMSKLAYEAHSFSTIVGEPEDLGTEGMQVTRVQYTSIDLGNAYVTINWDSKFPAQGYPRTFYLSDSDEPSDANDCNGYLREGKNVFEAFIDLNADGKYTPGEPYGVVAGVDVGWSGTEVSIELTDTTPQMARVDVAAAAAAADSDGGESATATDRDANGYIAPNSSVVSGGTNSAITASSTRVRVVRNWINGQPGDGTTSYGGVVLDKKMDLVNYPLFTEATLLANGELDLDWGGATKALAATKNAGQIITNVTYRIVLGDGPVGDYAMFANNLPFQFCNVYEASLTPAQTVRAGLSTVTGDRVLSARPTFVWRHDNAIGKDYPAFQIKVWQAKDDGKAGALVYDSGAQRAPVKNVEGEYAWTAPISANMMMTNGVVFATTNNYLWAVSMLDAKFTTFRPDATKRLFRMETSGVISDSGYGTVNAAVKYFGPGQAKTDAFKGLLHVQAFTSPDFTGTPAAETFVGDLAELSTTTARVMNASFIGLAPGDYYLRAFIDSNGNGTWDRWESMGYACYVGDTDAKLSMVSHGATGSASADSFVYTPKAVTVEAGKDRANRVDIYIEDADCDNDGFPDVYEYDQNGKEDFTKIGIPSGNTFFTEVNPELKAKLSAYLPGVNTGIESISGLPVYTLMSASPVAAAGLIAVETAGQDTEVAIKSFSLDDGIELEVATSTTTGTGLLSVSPSATYEVSVVVLGAESLDGAWTEYEAAKVQVSANGATKVEAATLKAALDEAKAAGKVFFKVSVRK